MIKSLSIWNSNTTLAEWALSLSNIGIKKAAVLPEPIKKLRKVFFLKSKFYYMYVHIHWNSNISYFCWLKPCAESVYFVFPWYILPANLSPPLCQ